jgi:hypothetical protein
MGKQKRLITSHKGGRTEIVQIRATKEFVKQCNDIKTITNENRSDLLHRIVFEVWATMFEGQIPIPSEAYREVGKIGLNRTLDAIE